MMQAVYKSVTFSTETPYNAVQQPALSNLQLTGIHKNKHASMKKLSLLITCKSTIDFYILYKYLHTTLLKDC